jgi:hypothetical protein
MAMADHPAQPEVTVTDQVRVPLPRARELTALPALLKARELTAPPALPKARELTAPPALPKARGTNVPLLKGPHLTPLIVLLRQPQWHP